MSGERLTMNENEMNEIRKTFPDFSCSVKAEEDSITQDFCDKVCEEFQHNCPFGNMAQKLKAYEDAEEQLEKVYGEHDGLLETVVKSLVKYNGEKPRKSRLLTDEDADKWEDYKRLEEQGLLVRLPLKIGDVVYHERPFATLHTGIQAFQVTNIMISQNKKCIWNKKYRAMHLLNGKIIDSQINFSFDDIGKTVFLTKEEAEAALAEMEG